MAGFFKGILQRLSNKADIDWDDIEEQLISADLGVHISENLIDELRGLGRNISQDTVHATCRQFIDKMLPADRDIAQHIASTQSVNNLPFTILMVGINGVGKTTSTAKLAYLLEQQQQSVLLAAGDTFRAAAVEQIKLWSERLNIALFARENGVDSAAVCYQAHQQAIKEQRHCLLCDTAGRLHTRGNLMEELKKIRRILAKQDAVAPHMTLLVIDASTGSNAYDQAKSFQEAIPIDGLIVTKMDGSSKGGMLLRIYKELGIAPYFIGVGEEVEQFLPFSKKQFIDSLFL